MPLTDQHPMVRACHKCGYSVPCKCLSLDIAKHTANIQHGDNKLMMFLLIKLLDVKKTLLSVLPFSACSGNVSQVTDVIVAQIKMAIKNIGKITESEHCTTTGPCLRMRHIPSACPVYQQCNHAKILIQTEASTLACEQ